jgi:hypothetical protein
MDKFMLTSPGQFHEPKFYAGIGSRTIPDTIRFHMSHIAAWLELRGWTLRSGNAEGSDQAFATGVNGSAAQIWLPWLGFQKEFMEVRPNHDYRVISPDDVEAYQSVIDYHPVGHQLNLTACKFMARNYRQVVGLNEPDSEFIICWTHDGTDVGGTGQAIRIARSKGIHVINMYEFTTAEAVINHLLVWHGI